MRNDFSSYSSAENRLEQANQDVLGQKAEEEADHVSICSPKNSSTGFHMLCLTDQYASCTG